jgi:hypothetical protein
MSKQIIIAVATEGTTDIRFLESIIQRTFEKIAFECSDLVEVFDPIFLEKVPGSIAEKARKYASQALDTGAMILCLHVDADAQTDETAFASLIQPAFEAIAHRKEYQELHDTLIAIVPVQMTEAWMLADKELLKKELGTKKNYDELGINKPPESFSDPKQAIEQAIQVAKQELSKRRRYKLKIGDLYQPLGQKVDLHYLESLPSYQKFQNAVRDVFIKLNYLNF